MIVQLFCLMARLATPAPAATPAPPVPPAVSPPPKPPGTPPTTQAKPAADEDDLAAVQAYLSGVLDDAVKAALHPDRNCADVIQPRVRIAYETVNPDDDSIRAHAKGLVELAHCAEQQRYFAFMSELGQDLWATRADGGHPEIFARALMGLGENDQALEFLAPLIKRGSFAKQSTVMLTFAKLACNVREWKTCSEISEHALARAKASKLAAEERRIQTGLAYKYDARAALHLGRLDQAQKLLDDATAVNADPDDLQAIRAELVPARLSKALVEVEPAEELPLGVYHLYGKVSWAGDLATVHLSNLDVGDHAYKVAVGVAGVTQTASKMVVVAKGAEQTVSIDPALLPQLDPTAVHAAKSVQLDVQIAQMTDSGEKEIFSQSYPLTLQPRDYLPLARFVDAEKRSIASTRPLMVAWMTPEVRPVEEFLAKAKLRAPQAAFSGMQDATVPQVKALYDELQARGVSYVNDPEELANDSVGQRVRLPSEVLSSTNAQCLEGAILYATLMEAIGLKPYVVIVPGHAFVGWEASPADNHKDLYFLETTATHSEKFEQAMQLGLKEADFYDGLKKSTYIDVGAARRAGVTAQPF